MCDPTADTPVFTNDNIDWCDYYFTFRSKYACPINAPTLPPTPTPTPTPTRAPTPIPSGSFLQLSLYKKECSGVSMASVSFPIGKCSYGFLLQYNPLTETATLYFSFSSDCSSSFAIDTFKVGTCSYLTKFKSYAGVDVVDNLLKYENAVTSAYHAKATCGEGEPVFVYQTNPAACVLTGITNS